MPKIKQRRKDCKYYAEQAMKAQGWKVNSSKQEKYNNKECAIFYTNIQTKLETQMSYTPVVFFKILFDMDDNNDMFEVNDEILQYVTKYVEDSNAPYCTSFYFESTDFIELGTSFRCEMIGRFLYERDWVTEF